MLEVANLEVVYNEVVLVLRGLSLEVRDGQIVALLGANGAGKTTALRAITGLLDIHEGDITKGSITFGGERIDGRNAPGIVKSGISQVMEGRRVFAEMTVDENLKTGSVTNSSSASVKAAYERVMDLFPPLSRRRKEQAGFLSGGEQQMLAIGRALMTNPKLLILDEATEGLAPVIREEIWACLKNLKQDGQSILLIDKNLKALLEIGDFHNIIEKGRNVWRGSSAELAAEKETQHRYLGV